MNEFKKKVIKLFLNHPFDYPKYISMLINKDYAFKIIKSLIPTDTGIEWEIGDLMISKLMLAKSKNKQFIKLKQHWESFETSYRIRHEKLDSSLLKIYEMYRFMNKSFNNDNRLNQSGIHIHTNIPREFNIRTLLREPRIRDINRLVKIVSNRYFEYEGKYNKLKFSIVKGYAIIFRSDFNTIEYRCINMTYNFRTLIKHIIVCHLITTNLIKFQDYDPELIRVKMVKLIDDIMTIKDI